MPRLLYLSVGEPRTVPWRGQDVTTAIFKEPVEGRRAVRGVNIEGDHQANPKYHGGDLKAVYGYAREHHGYWQGLFPDHEFPPGCFGENLTTEGLLEEDLHLGDLLVLGTAELEVMQPRMPCANLAVRFDDPEVVRAFADSRRPGFYLRIAREGEIGAGDEIRHVVTDASAPTVRDVADLRYGVSRDAGLARAALDAGTLSPEWADALRKLAG